jgi:tRNA (cytidine56-2'-O)-methyltransferase
MDRRNHYYVLRLNHRYERDKRLTTHIALIARAFNARGFIYTGEEDIKLEDSINAVNNTWSTDHKFSVLYWDDWIKNLKLLLLKNVVLVHLTMYGEKIQNLQKEINQIYTEGFNIIFVVGGAKVPEIIYKMSKYNISVTNQPHSEAGALAVALDRVFPDSINSNLA